MSWHQYWHFSAIFGCYLQFAGEVLSVVAHQNIAEAQKNAACNNIKNVQYFGGSPVEALPQIAEKIAYDKACAVMISSAIRSSAGKYLWMLYVMFSCRVFKPSGMRQCVVGWVVPDVSEDHGAFIFRVKRITDFALYTCVGRLLCDASGYSKILKSRKPSSSVPPDTEDEGTVILPDAGIRPLSNTALTFQNTNLQQHWLGNLKSRIALFVSVWISVSWNTLLSSLPIVCHMYRFYCCCYDDSVATCTGIMCYQGIVIVASQVYCECKLASGLIIS